MQPRQIFLLLLSVLSLLFTFEVKGLTPEQKIDALLRIHDHREAAFQARQFLDKSPDSLHLWELYITALAQSKDEANMLSAWSLYREQFPSANNTQQLAETVAWGIIEKAAISPQPLVRLYGCIAAAFVNQTRSLPILIGTIRDPHAELRATAAHLSLRFRDSVLHKEVLSAFRSEKNPAVKEQLIRALGAGQRDQIEPILKFTLGSSQATFEEKAAALEAILSHKETIDQEEIKTLIKSDRAALRQLACLIAVQTLAYQEIALLIPLVRDPSPDVRLAALYACGLLSAAQTQIEESVHSCLKDPEPYVSTTAAWLFILKGHSSGLEVMRRSLESPHPEVCRFASGALAVTGSKGIELMKETLSTHDDPFVRANVAIGLISQRCALDDAAQYLFSFLNDSHQKIAWNNDHPIHYLSASLHMPQPSLLNYSEAKSLAVKIQLFKLLSAVDPSRAEQALRTFLKHSSWEISGLAASLLLSDVYQGDGEIVERLLEDSDERVRVQAALICALFGREERAIPILEKAYHTVDREMKERIVEALGQIGDERMIPFLINILNEPSQTLRVITAAALLKLL